MGFEAIVWTAVGVLIVVLVGGVAFWVWRADREDFQQTRHERRDPGSGGPDRLGVQTPTTGEQIVHRL